MLNNLFTQRGTPAYTEETIDVLRLIRSENVGPRTFAHLVSLFGSAKKALENIEDFSIKGGRSKPIKKFSKDMAEKELEILAKNKAYLIT